LALNTAAICSVSLDKATAGSTVTHKEHIFTVFLTLKPLLLVVMAWWRCPPFFRVWCNMQRDGGMMQMFLMRLTPERMHLLSFVRLKDPNRLFRAAVIAGQAGFASVFCWVT
jgi:hypothetical protein